MGDCFNNRLYRHVVTLTSQGCGGGGDNGVWENTETSVVVHGKIKA